MQCVLLTNFSIVRHLSLYDMTYSHFSINRMERLRTENYILFSCNQGISCYTAQSKDVEIPNKVPLFSVPANSVFNA